MTGSRGWGDRSCMSVKCTCEVMCCDQRNSALTWPAVSHSWSFTGLPSTATTAAEKNKSKSQTTLCLMGLPSSLTYTGKVDRLGNGLKTHHGVFRSHRYCSYLIYITLSFISVLEKSRFFFVCLFYKVHIM